VILSKNDEVIDFLTSLTIKIPNGCWENGEKL